MAEIEKHREKLWFSVLVNILLLLILLLVFRPVYETNDDMGMANMVNGAKGVYDPHLVFSHYLLGLFLSCLYRMTDRITWYPVIQYCVLFASFTAVTYVWNRRRKRAADVWICALFLVVFSYEGYIRLQFTKTAGIVSAAGMFLLFYAITQERIQRKAFLAGMLLACAGFMYRMNQFFAEGLLMTGIGVYQLLRLRELPRGSRLKRLLLYIGTFGFLVAVVLGLHRYEQHVYGSSQEWQEYLTYNKLRGKLYDFGFPGYKENKEAYREMGISSAAYNMYRSWNHMDTERFTTELMTQIRELQPEKSIDGAFIREFFGVFPVSFFTISVFYCFLLLVLYWLFWGRHGGAEIITVVYESVIVLFLYFYLYYVGRYLHNRVDVGIWFAVSLIMLWIYREERHRFHSRTGMVLFLGAVLLYQRSWKTDWRISNSDAVMQRERAVIGAIHNDSEHLYLTKVKTVSFANSYGVFDRIPFGMAMNTYSLGGWASKSPVYSSVLSQYGVINPFRDMVGNEKVYLIDDDIDATMDYIHKYYDKDAEAVEAFELFPYQVYQIQAGTDS